MITSLVLFLCGPTGCGSKATASITPPHSDLELTVSDASLAFGSVSVGASSTKAVTLTSSGNATVTVESVTVKGTGFSFSGGTLPAALNPGQSISLQVAFAPTAAGDATGSLTISSNSSAATSTVVNLSGTGNTSDPVLTLSATSLDFNAVGVGHSVALPLTLTSSGSAPLTVNSATISGNSFTVSGASFPATLDPGQSISLQVSFAPTAAGSATGSLTFASNSSSGVTTVVNLSGTGNTSDPVLTLSATSLNFNDVEVGQSVALPLTLTSSGNAPVTVNSASTSGKPFTVSGATFPVTLNPDVAVTLSVNFAPTATGSASGTLTVASNSINGITAVVNLSGTGNSIQHSVSLTWTAPQNSPVQVAGYNIYRSIPGDSAVPQLLNASPETQTSYVDGSVVSGSSYTYFVESVGSDGTQSVPSDAITLTIP